MPQRKGPGTEAVISDWLGTCEDFEVRRGTGMERHSAVNFWWKSKMVNTLNYRNGLR